LTRTSTKTDTPTRTPTPSYTPTKTLTFTSTPTPSKSWTPTKTPTKSLTPTKTKTETGTPTWTGTPSLTPTPGTGFLISRNVYNPETDFPAVTVSVHLSQAGHYTLKVYNSAGELVKTLRAVQAAGAPLDDIVEWDGKNDAGNPVASGVYILQFTSRFDQRTAKLLILR
jgi:hypothetical protein